MAFAVVKISPNNDSEAAGRNERGEMEREKHGLTVPAGRKPVFRLYISGATPKSTQAVMHLGRVLKSLFDGEYELGVIDIYQEPHKARTVRIAAVPLLIRELPTPARWFVGDFSSTVRIQQMLCAGNRRGNVGKTDGRQNQR